MNIWKLSHGTKLFSPQERADLLNRKAGCLHPETAAKGQSARAQGEQFLEAEVGDVVFICESNEKITSLGMFVDALPYYSRQPNRGDWVERSYELLLEAKDPTGYNQGLRKWWTPADNSTFIAVPENEDDQFEREILKPVFGIDLKKLIQIVQARTSALQLTMDDLMKTQEKLFQMEADSDLLFRNLNQLFPLTLQKLEFLWEPRKDGPVVSLRKLVLKKLLERLAPVTASDLQSWRSSLEQTHGPASFRIWKRDFSILFPFFTELDKPAMASLLNRTALEIQTQLGLEKTTSVKTVDFAGARNQGSSGFWVAIYNKSFPSQEMAYQLFFQVDSPHTFQYGLYHRQNRSTADFQTEQSFDIERVVAHFRNHINTILGDNMENQRLLADSLELIKANKNLVLTGAPGTGKTYLAKKLASALTAATDGVDRIGFVQFHPSYDYTDFVEGLRPVGLSSEGVRLEVRPGSFKAFCQKAAQDPDHDWAFIIDEINRADLSRVFGEMFFGLEANYRGEEISTQYSYLTGQKMTIPENLFLIGTMNDVDRSVESMDFALRRRFAWKEITAKDSEAILTASSLDPVLVTEALKRMDRLNSKILEIFQSRAYQIGGAYFRNLDKYAGSDKPFQRLWANHLELLLTEYLRGMNHAGTKLGDLKVAFGD